MESGLVVHAEVGESTRSEALAVDRPHVGRGAGHELRLPYTLTTISSPDIRHDRGSLNTDRSIGNGDEVQAGCANTAPGLLSSTSVSLTIAGLGRPRHLAPFIEQAALEAEAPPRRDDARVFLREFTRELIRETRPATKTVVLLFVLALLGGILYLGYAAYNVQRQDRALISAQGEKLDEHGRQLDEQGQRLEEVKRQAGKPPEQLPGLASADKSLAGGQELAPKLWSSYHEGVCLISGTYIFVEPGTNRPLRYKETLLNEEGEPLLSRDDLEYLTPEGDGPVAEFGYVGTGFHVGQGFIITNRHVGVGPWESDARVQLLRGMTGGQPRLKSLVAFFPGRRQPLVLKFERASKSEDLAVCRLRDAAAYRNLPALPFAEDADALLVGERVVTMGYPSGPERLLALLPEDESVGIQKGHGPSEESLIGELAARGMIRPLMTQGNVTDLYQDRIVNDATTGEGGSGAPVFGQRGRVVGITFAIFLENDASNFAVPAGQAVKLLRQSGWTKEN